MSLPELSLTRYVGHRGAALIILGVTWMAFGLLVIAQPTPARPLVFHEHLPPWVRLMAWVTTGGLAVLYGLRGAKVVDTPGMLALMIMPLERVCSFLGSWFAWCVSSAWHALDPDVDVMGFSGGWYSAAVWLLVVIVVRLVAGWPNPRPYLPPTPASVDG